MIKLGEHIVNPTKFPDGTSQVWKLPEIVLKNENTITWNFENEAELSHILQLAKLSEYTRKDRPNLIMPFLPYGRQDKPITNTSTFARQVIIDVLKPHFLSMSTYDSHSHCDDVVSLSVDTAIDFALNISNPNFIIFPDNGAANRNYPTYSFPVIILDKKRNQITGEIEGLQFTRDYSFFNFKNMSALIVDDLCDGGRTFIEASKLLKQNGISQVYLYTTHGIYSKGIKNLFDGGIDRIFNLKGEVHDAI